MKTKTRAYIVNLLQELGPLSPHEMKMHLRIGGPALHRQLLKLLAAGQIEKVGKPPKVNYQLAKQPAEFLY